MNRRFLSQFTAAKILRLESVIRSRNLDITREVNELLRAVEEEDSLHEEDRKQVLRDPGRAMAIKEALPEGCQLAVLSSVFPNILKIGKIICDEVNRLSQNTR